jgi:hypothetical protein
MGGVPFGENWSLLGNQLISKNAASFNPHSNTTFDSNSTRAFIGSDSMCFEVGSGTDTKHRQQLNNVSRVYEDQD